MASTQTQDIEAALTLAEKSKRGFQLWQAFEAGTLDPRDLATVSDEEWDAASQACEILEAIEGLECAS